MRADEPIGIGLVDTGELPRAQVNARFLMSDLKWSCQSMIFAARVTLFFCMPAVGTLWPTRAPEAA